MTSKKTHPRGGPTRRRFLEGLAGAACAGVAGPAMAWQTVPLRAPSETPHAHAPTQVGAVAAVHLDEPYLDRSGTATPYVPGQLRGGDALGRFPEAVLRCHHCYL